MWTAVRLFLGGNWKPIVIGLAVVGAIWIAYSWAYDRGVAHEKTKTGAMLDRVVAEHNRQAAEAAAAASAREHVLQAKVDEQAKELGDEYRTNAELSLANSALQRSPVDPQRLRDQLATSRLAAAAAASSAEAACNSRSAAYEALLARGDGLLARGAEMAGRIAKSHDDRAAEVEKLVRAWPQ